MIRKDLGGVKEGENMAWMYSVREECIFNNKKLNKKKRIMTTYANIDGNVLSAALLHWP